jgi:hypothetical protein
MSACGHSIVISRRDPKLLSSLERLQRTERLIETSSASEAERRLFMMAESFYRYRFDVPRPKLKAYLAQTAAVVTELPAFQELSAALDISYLRLKSYDGAAQLWETLLAAYPDSPLAALTLYRLGWVYRSTSAAGLPRDSRAAFLKVAHGEPSSELGQLALAAHQTPWKSQDATMAYSLFPGLPQLYVGEYTEGGIRIAVGLGSLAAVVIPTVLAIQRGGALSFKHDWPLLLTGSCGLLVLTIDYAGSYQQGVHSVVEFNERQEARFERSRPGAP